LIPASKRNLKKAIRLGLDTVIAKANGFRHYEIRRSVESPGRYLLQIHWQTLEDHVVGFRESPAYTEWRNIVGPFFARPPAVEHFELIATSKP
jgi:heme-degrading monooxygenase HmoA